MKNLVKGAILTLGLFAIVSFAQAQQKIGYINADEVFQATPEFKSASEVIMKLSNEKQQELEGMVKMIEEKQNDVDEKYKNRSEANKETIDAEILTLSQEIQQMRQRIQDVQRVAQEEVGKKQQELMAPIQTKVMNAINAVAKEKNFAYILDLGTGAVIYYQGGEDITPDVKAKLGLN